ncbi:MAG: hypothetical protein KF773_03055 [Deltaproteobacteria bacterium]|nr:hypothetical protein [Deltaproteobacteria bacterium]MCW5806926.1 hypothetical protein [Deltaproteobacteria bacterium]
MIFGTSAFADTGNASGMGPGLFAGADGNLSIKRSLVHFDLSSLSPSVTATAVHLDLKLGQIAGSGGGGGGGGGCGMFCDYDNRQFYLLRVTHDWTEGTTGSPTSPNMSGTGQGWSYSTCNCSDVSWDYYSYTAGTPPTGKWTTAGSSPYQDVDTTPDATATFSTPYSLGMTHTFDGDSMTNANMLATVNAWIDGVGNGGVANYGWEIRSVFLEDDQASFLGWWSKDVYMTSMAHSTFEGPVLRVIY